MTMSEFGLRRLAVLAALNLSKSAVSRERLAQDILHAGIELLPVSLGAALVLNRNQSWIESLLPPEREAALLAALYQPKGLLDSMGSTPAWQVVPDEASRKLALIPEVQACLVIPLFSGAQVWLGTLLLLEDQPRTYSAEDMTFARILANQAQTALELNIMLQRLEWAALYDSLTGLHNRRYLYEAGIQLVEFALRHGQALCALIVDVDHFKQVNDRWGHLVGDQALQEVAAVLRRMSRESDLICRYGGEEFVFLLPNTNACQGTGLAERLRQAVSAIRMPVGEDEVRFTVSVGVADWQPGDAAPNLDDLLQRADQALYAAKQAGRNRVMRYDERDC